MTSATIQMERFYPAGHRDRHTPRLCPECDGPLTTDGRCTHCGACAVPGHSMLPSPDRLMRLERMERAAFDD